MISATNQLSEQQLSDLKHLAAECKRVDENLPNFYYYILEQHRILPASLTYYEDHQLLAFLSVYFFYEGAVEATMVIHPKFRRKGIAKQLMQQAYSLLEINNIQKVIFTNPAQKNNDWLQETGFKYQHSEYHMVRNELSPILHFTSKLTFREAKLQDGSEMMALDLACFPKKEHETPEHLQNLLLDQRYTVMLALLDGKVIGKTHIRWEDYGACFSDISIFPEYQGKGYGTALIAHCINYTLSEGKTKIHLDVETHNKNALHLYHRLGFVTDNACDYWSISVSELKKLLHFP